MATSAISELPLVDYRDLGRNRSKFLKELHHALHHVGFLVLANAPGLDDVFQTQLFKEVRTFYDAPMEVKMEAHIAKTPHFRGYTEPLEASEQRLAKIELFQYGMEKTPVADSSDESVPLYERVMRGPNTWPKKEDLPGFQPSIEKLNAVYHELTHELGHLIMECLGEDPARFDEIFSKDDPALAASLNKNWDMDQVAPELREKTIAAFSELKSPNVGAHIDKHPFIALLINDKPGLQVVADDNRWIDAPVTCRTAPGEYGVPVVPGSVIVNTGGTLMHLSKGRCPATLHRVNTTLIPQAESRVSMPYFLLPRMDGPLIPFGDEIEDTGYNIDRNRGQNAAVERMATFPQVTKVWWMKEFRNLRNIQTEESIAETNAAYDLAAKRAANKGKTDALPVSKM